MAGLGIALLPALAFGQSTSFPLQKYTWKPVVIKGGGFIDGLVFNNTQPGLAYCRTDVGSAFKWDNQKKVWIPLTDWVGDANLMGAESVATDPIDPQRVYIAAGMHVNEPAAILRSMDQGKTFQTIPVPFRMGGNENGRGVGERLAIDPNDNNILYFGSRQAGLWVSKDTALTWAKVDSFPSTTADAVAAPAAPRAEAGAPGAAPGDAAGARRGRGGPGGGGSGGRGGGGVGLSFVVFDPSTGTRGQPTKTIYVGSTDPGPSHLFRSTNAGQTWQPVAGQPANFMPGHAGFDTQGILYVAYANSPGPGGATDGAVWKFNPKDGVWTDITPVKDANKFPGGYGGLGIDRQHPGTLVVASLDRVNPSLPQPDRDDDRIYRTTNGGQTWMDISPKSHRDSSGAPYVPWAGVYDANNPKPEASVGWWIDGLAIDPFNSSHVAYCTGTIMWGTMDMENADSGGDTHWTTCTDGLEELCVAQLISPPAGPHLLSAVSDVGNFTHDDLDVSPPQGMALHPLFANSTWMDIAYMNPSVVVRIGVTPYHGPKEGTMGYSLDGGYNWKPFSFGGDAAAAGGRRGGGGGGGGGGNVILSADGKVFMSTGGTPRISTDHGTTWKDVTGLSAGLSPIADRANGAKFYALDAAAHRMYLSTDGGATFADAYAVTGLPAGGGGGGERGGRAGRGGGGGGGFGGGRLVAVGGREGDPWFVGPVLCHSTDGGKTFKEIPNHPPIGASGSIVPFSFGKAAPGKDYPAIFVLNRNGSDGPAVYRSDDVGATWVRVNDAQHLYGRIDCLTGDPRIYGRVYLGLFGHGAVYGDIAN